MRVAELWRYPVKSLRGERLEEAEVGPAGIAGDRAYAVVDRSTGKVLSAKRERRLFEASARWTGGTAEIALPGGDIVDGDDPAAGDALSNWLDRDVALSRAATDTRARFDMHEISDDPSTPLLQITCPPGTFFDGAPLHLLTTSTLRALSRVNPGGQWDPRRFRPNLLIETEAEGFVEDGWMGTSMRVGGADVVVVAPTGRCVMTTHAQSDLDRDVAILTTVNRVKGGDVGVYAVAPHQATVRVGDPVEPS